MPRILCLCLDSADKTLLLDWARQGKLPHLKKLLDRGAYATAKIGDPGFYTGPVWPSFYTGVSVEQHGKFAYRQLVPGSYEVRKFPLSAIDAVPFWHLLSERHHRVAVIDLAKTLLDRSINGIQLVRWGAHDAEYFDPLCYPAGTFQATPAEFAAEIPEKWPAPTFGWSDVEIGQRDTGAITHFRDGLVAKIAAKTQMSLDLLVREPWELFAVNYPEAHSVGHHCWHLTDESAPTFDPELQQCIGDPVLAVYQATDQAIGQLCEAVGEDVYVALFSSLSMGPHISGEFAMDALLRSFDGGEPTRAIFYRWMRTLWEHIPGPVKRRLRRAQEASRNRLLEPERGARRFFAVQSNSDYGAVRINLIGREPNGKVAPGDAFEQTCTELTQAFLELRNPETNEPIVERVIRSDSLYQRSDDDTLPDLLVEWRKNHPIRSFTSPRIGQLDVVNRERRTGDHRPDGLFVLAGPGITAGELPRPLSVLELAPTLCALLGERYDVFEREPVSELMPEPTEPEASRTRS